MEGPSEFYLDNGHRKAVVMKVNENALVVVVDAVPRDVDRSRFAEFTKFVTLEIARQRINVADKCFSDKYSYELIDEAVCLGDDSMCLRISYIVYIRCNEMEWCSWDKVFEVVRCILSSINLTS